MPSDPNDQALYGDANLREPPTGIVRTADSYDMTIGARVHAATSDAWRSYNDAERLIRELVGSTIMSTHAVMHGEAIRRRGQAVPVTEILLAQETLVREVVTRLNAGLHAAREAIALAAGSTTRPTAWERLALGVAEDGCLDT